MSPADKFKNPDYWALAEFRYRIRCFLRFSEQAARAAGLEPQQHQLLLALRALPQGKKPTIRVLAERLQIEHHSAVELVDRLEQRGFVRRYRDEADRRQVLVQIAPTAQELLQELSLHHMTELRSVGPELVRVLNILISGDRDAISRFRQGMKLEETGFVEKL
ncbi:MAG: MarR family transcriptional regulator [Deltaproteobacteria bacterium]|nr:MarR family transcriptional regulator [Deltaproteobacteria bacterium]